jgi:hypothetical protein
MILITPMTFKDCMIGWIAGSLDWELKTENAMYPVWMGRHKKKTGPK